MVNLIEDRDKAKGEYLRAYCAYETLKVERFSVPTALIVPRELANSRCDGPLYPMPFDHLTISEVTSVNDDRHLWTMAKVEEAGANAAARRKAAGLVEEGDALHLAGKHGESRMAYDQARTIYMTLDDSQGKATVLLGLGHLKRKLGRNDQARAVYTEARPDLPPVVVP